MSAQKYAIAVGGIAEAAGYGAYWTFCPIHSSDIPTLLVIDGPKSKILVKCFGGCTQKSVEGALRALGLWSDISKFVKVV